MTLAPIVLFVYNRLDHTKQTIEALQKNVLARESALFVYSDAPKNEEAVAKVNEVREYIKSIDGFKKVTIIERENNLGLANSIVNGVTNIVNKYGKIIVLEDDLVTSPYFLKFMNEALEFYEDEEKVWHVSGWNYPVDSDGLEDGFLWRLMNCWGWATWANKWSYYKKDVDQAINEFSKDDIKRFDLDGYVPYWSQVVANKEKIIDSWAVFWYVSIFKHNGLCLNPVISYVRNIGLDGTGVHCGKENSNESFILNMKGENNIKSIQILQENKRMVEIIKKYLAKKNKSFLFKVINKISKLFYKKTYFKRK